MTAENPGSIKNRGWTVTLVALSINLVLGVLYAWGVMAKALVVQWHWSKADAALPFTVATGAFAITRSSPDGCKTRLARASSLRWVGSCWGSAWWHRRTRTRPR